MHINELLSFSHSYEELKERKLPIAVSYKLTKINEQAQKDIAYYQQKFSEIILQYAQLDENGQPLLSEDKNNILLKPESMQICSEEMSELEQLDYEGYTSKIKLIDITNLEISPATLEGLIPFIEE